MYKGDTIMNYWRSIAIFFIVVWIVMTAANIKTKREHKAIIAKYETKLNYTILDQYYVVMASRDDEDSTLINYIVSTGPNPIGDHRYFSSTVNMPVNHQILLITLPNK